MVNRDLHDVLARLYASEINVVISTQWDGGWDVKLGDEMNGFVEETTIMAGRTLGLHSVAMCRDSLEEVAQWLDAQAREHFPLSAYAKTPWCCHVGCAEGAEFELIAVRYAGDSDHADGQVLQATGAAGPDPHSDYTHACEAHVGELLGFQPDAVERGNIYWQVRTLAPVMLAR